MSQPGANQRFAPSAQTTSPLQAKPDTLRERTARLVSRLEDVKLRLGELRYNLIGVTIGVEGAQGNASANPLPLPHVSESMIEILDFVCQIEVILTDIETNI